MDLSVEPRTVLRQTVDNLRTAILEGVLKPGERLVEADLCARLKVSRPSLREALRTLEAERLIVITPNRGPFVSTLDWETAQQIYRVRALLEGEAAALSAGNAGAEELAQMHGALERFAEAVEAGDADGRIRSTAEFYQALQVGSGNRIILELLQGLLSRINVLRTRSMSSGTRSERSLAEMRVIYRAIEAGDPAAARLAAIEHIENAARAAQHVFESEHPS